MVGLTQRTRMVLKLSKNSSEIFCQGSSLLRIWLKIDKKILPIPNQTVLLSAYGGN